MTKAASPHAVTFVRITMFLDMVGFGFIISVSPVRVQDAGTMSAMGMLAGALVLFAAVKPREAHV
jgi:hypothetical protein